MCPPARHRWTWPGSVRLCVREAAHASRGSATCQLPLTQGWNDARQWEGCGRPHTTHTTHTRPLLYDEERRTYRLRQRRARHEQPPLGSPCCGVQPTAAPSPGTPPQPPSAAALSEVRGRTVCRSAPLPGKTARRGNMSWQWDSRLPRSDAMVPASHHVVQPRGAPSMEWAAPARSKDHDKTMSLVARRPVTEAR